MVPAWRGLSHELAIVPVAVFGIWVVVAADGLLASVALTTHAILLVAMLVISSIYHRHAHSLEAKLWARRADHAAIFGLIAASYTPICLLATTRWLGLPVLAVAWLVAARGAWLKLAHLQLGQDRFNSWMYAALGSGAVILIPSMIANMGWSRVLLILAGGLSYILGGLVLIAKRPNPSPARFGFHEIWHLAALFGAVLHLGVNATLG